MLVLRVNTGCVCRFCAEIVLYCFQNKNRKGALKLGKNFNELALKMHREHQGKVETISRVKLETRDDLSTAYTPGVAEPCRKIHENPEAVYEYTLKGRTIAVVSDGSAVLGLGNIGAQAAIPVMEGKAVLFKEFGGVDAVPICLDTQDTEEIIRTVKNIPPVALKLSAVWKKSWIFLCFTMTSMEPVLW